MATPPTCARCGRRPVETGEHLCTECREELGPAAAAAAATAKSREEQDSDLDLRRSRWPATMVKPSPVQYHATIYVTIFLVLAALGVWAFLGHRGVGPFDAGVSSTGPFRNGTQAIVVRVENQGSRSSRATCSFRALDAANTEIAAATVLTDPIPGHATAEVTHVFRGLRAEPAGFDTVCT
jgi:hypothetical protein